MDPCTQDSCEPASGCVHAGEPLPVELCLAAGSAQLQVKDDSSDAKDRLKWKWRKGSEFDQSVLGDPGTDGTSTYRLCIYDSSAAISRLVTSLVIDPNPAWQNKAPKGLSYKDKDGAVGEGEKIFSLKRQIDSGTGSGNYRIQGHGHYSHYHSPMWDIASGMMLGSMLSSAFAPDYRPVYVQHNTYTTSPTRARAIRTNRASYRKANPAKFNSKPRRLTTKSSAKPSKNKVKKSKSKRNYGSKGNKWGSRPSTRRRTGGSKFGTRRRREKVIRLEA